MKLFHHFSENNVSINCIDTHSFSKFFFSNCLYLNVVYVQRGCYFPCVPTIKNVFKIIGKVLRKLGNVSLVNLANKFSGASLSEFAGRITRGFGPRFRNMCSQISLGPQYRNKIAPPPGGISMNAFSRDDGTIAARLLHAWKNAKRKDKKQQVRTNENKGLDISRASCSQLLNFTTIKTAIRI